MAPRRPPPAHHDPPSRSEKRWDLGRPGARPVKALGSGQIDRRAGSFFREKRPRDESLPSSPVTLRVRVDRLGSGCEGSQIDVTLAP